MKQAAPDLFVMVSNFHADGETVIQCMRAGANEFLLQPIKRTEFRDAMGRLERAPRHGAAAAKASSARSILSSARKGGVGTTTHGRQFRRRAGAAQEFHRAPSTWTGSATTSPCNSAPSPQYTLMEVAENLERMDQALFEGFVTRDPLGFFLVGPPDALEQHGHFSEHSSASSRRSWWRSTTPS